MDELDQTTCGMGLAESSKLPEKMGKFLSSLGEVLEEHTKALDLTDKRSRKELDAYNNLVHQIKDISVRLASIGIEMKGYQDLPMGKHYENAMLSRNAVDVFQNYIAQKKDLLELLKSTVDQEQEILDHMS
jgi:flagellar biosynthesis chaperone FliJ